MRNHHLNQVASSRVARYLLKVRAVSERSISPRPIQPLTTISVIADRDRSEVVVRSEQAPIPTDESSTSTWRRTGRQVKPRLPDLLPVLSPNSPSRHQRKQEKEGGRRSGAPGSHQSPPLAPRYLSEGLDTKDEPRRTDARVN